MKKKIIEPAIILIILIICFIAVRNVMQFKYGDGILGVKFFYEQPENSIDVLILGSSHAFEDINTAQLYDDYGISSYILSGSVQPLWNTYYNLQEALKTQSPKVIVLEAYTVTKTYDYADHSRIIKNNFGIKDPVTRMKSIIASAPADKLDDYILDYRLWHSTYEEIDASNFSDYYKKPIYAYYKGFGINYDTTKYERPDIDSFVGESPVSPRQEEYFRKIIELCQSKNIPIKVIVSPYIIKKPEQMKFNYLQHVAEEYGVEYINYNSSEYYDLLGLDFATDYADFSHLNTSGTKKYTKAVGELLKGSVELPDRRNDPSCESWVYHSKDVNSRIADNQFSEVSDTEEFLRLFNSEDLSEKDIYIYTISNSNKLAETGLFTRLGLYTVPSDGQLYIRNKADGSYSLYSTDNSWKFFKEYASSSLSINHSITVNGTGCNVSDSIMLSSREYIERNNGCYVIIYDSFTNDLAAVKYFSLTKDGLQMENR